MVCKLVKQVGKGGRKASRQGEPQLSGPGRAKVAELVDALDLGSSASRREGSSPSFRTNAVLLQRFPAVGFAVSHVCRRFLSLSPLHRPWRIHYGSHDRDPERT